MKTIYILWLRQIKKYFRSPARMIGSLGQPLLFLIALGYGLGPVFAKAGGGNYIQFLVPGILGMTIIFSSIFSGIDIIVDKQFGFLKETLIAPVSRFNVMIGRTLGGATTSTMQGFIVFLISLLLGFKISNIFLVFGLLFLMLLVSLLFTALGTFIATKLDDMQSFPLIINFLIMPLFFLSGSVFPLVGLPAIFDFITKINPLSYGIDAFRSLLGGMSAFGLGLDILVLALVALFFIAIGSRSFSKMQV